MKIIKPFIAYSILILVMVLFWQGMANNRTHRISSPLVNELLPNFELPELFKPETILSSNELKGRFVLLNVFATWCSACFQEQAMLLKIKNEYHMPIYGIDYKDDALAAVDWLKKYGNPYIKIGSDTLGNVAIDLGVYGTPETFLINKEGKIIYRHIGVIDQQEWDDVLLPIIKKYA